MTEYEYLRVLDIDDLIILSSLLDYSRPMVTIAKELRLTSPALSHRLKKYKIHIPDFNILAHKSGHRELSPEAEKFCANAKKALKVLGFDYDEYKKTKVTIDDDKDYI